MERTLKDKVQAIVQKFNIIKVNVGVKLTSEVLISAIEVEKVDVHRSTIELEKIVLVSVFEVEKAASVPMLVAQAAKTTEVPMPCAQVEKATQVHVSVARVQKATYVCQCSS
ncbi:hypothetical protein K7X08_012553 [Anisodus acutangulus]|uniref:Uncharacterized protein n=1 Tax=Anisodus acutangulus TaxID=402998 RepID=A0A9Q1LEB2_9SOLA|nr:hypothetical protein K7X08_012553 [Anisodus acutangulus]